MTETANKSRLFISLEVLVALLLAFSALGTAWANWMSQLHGSNEAENYALSAALRAKGSSQMNASSLELTTALATWNDLVALDAQRKHYESEGQTAAAALAQGQIDYIITVTCNDTLAAQVRSALAQDPVPNVFDEATVASYYAGAQKLLDEAEDAIQQGNRDNLHSDAFAFVGVLYSLVLFLLGATSIIKSRGAKKVLVGAGVAAFVVATVYMLSLPLPTDFAFGTFFGLAG